MQVSFSYDNGHDLEFAAGTIHLPADLLVTLKWPELSETDHDQVISVPVGPTATFTATDPIRLTSLWGDRERRVWQLGRALLGDRLWQEVSRLFEHTETDEYSVEVDPAELAELEAFWLGLREAGVSGRIRPLPRTAAERRELEIVLSDPTFFARSMEALKTLFPGIQLPEE
jgi:hypothetical protein